MAKMRVKKVSGNTIIEVLVAMVIIMVVFAIAIRVFANVMGSGLSLVKVRAQQQLDLLAKQVQEQGYLEQNEARIDSLDYYFTADTSSLAGYSKLFIQARQNGKLLGEIKCYFKEGEIGLED